MIEYPASELQECAERELRMRRNVYPRWIAEGKMTREKAEREIDRMEAIARHFATLAEKERLL
jgi:hypothetical protein